MPKKILVFENMEDLHLDYEYDDDFNEQDENVPPAVEGVVILSEDDEAILDLNATTTLHELPLSTLTPSVFLKSNFMNRVVFSDYGKESSFIDV